MEKLDRLKNVSINIIHEDSEAQQINDETKISKTVKTDTKTVASEVQQMNDETESSKTVEIDAQWS